jgi:serralysin
MPDTVSTQASTVIVNAYSGNYRIDVLLPSATARWNNGSVVGSAVTVTYSFMSVAPSYALDEDRKGFTSFNTEQMMATRKILDQISQQVGITFQETTDSISSYGTIRFGNNDQGQTSAGYASYPDTNDRDSSGDMYINNLNPDNLSNITPGTNSWATLVHEIGHTLGLKHPGNYNAGEAASTVPDNYLAAAEDTEGTTVMSYVKLPQQLERDFYGAFDLLALKYLYGGLAFNSTDTSYKYDNAAGQKLQIINDTGGNDTIDLSAIAVGATVNLTAGSFSSVGVLADGVTPASNNLSLAFDAVIENVIGSPLNDNLKGNSANNRFTGAAGNDALDGGIGIDTAVFSLARIDYTVSPGTTVTVKANRGTDGTDTLSNIERLQFSDSKLAIDMGATQSGGESALLIGAVLGKAALTNKEVVGQLLSYFDTGSKMLDAATVLVSTGIMDQLAGGASTGAYVNLLYHALTGQTANSEVVAQLTPLIDGGSYSKASFLAAVAELPLNQTNVDLIGLQQTGIEFT